MDLLENLVTGGILQVIGFVIQIMALLTLNRSIGLLPAYRGVQSGGLYSWVRLPLYIADVINNQSFYSAAVVLAGTPFLVMRIYCEEKLLLKYADCTRYANCIRWCLIPAIW